MNWNHSEWENLIYSPISWAGSGVVWSLMPTLYTWTMAWKKRFFCLLIQISLFQNYTSLKFCQLVWYCKFAFSTQIRNTQHFLGRWNLNSDLNCKRFISEFIALVYADGKKYEKSDSKKCKHFKWVERVRCVMFQRNQRNSHVWTKHIEFRHNMP